MATPPGATPLATTFAVPIAPASGGSTQNRVASATPTASPSIPTTTPAAFTPTSTPSTFTSTYGASAYGSVTGVGAGMVSHTGQRIPAKRGRKPKNAMLGAGVGGTPGRSTPNPTIPGSFATTSGDPALASHNAGSGSGTGGYSVHWAIPNGAGPGESGPAGSSSSSPQIQGYTPSTTNVTPGAAGASTPGSNYSTLDSSGLLTYSTGAAGVRLGSTGPVGAGVAGVAYPGQATGEDDGELDDDMLPAMADDDYSAGLSWQSQSKDNLKVLMDNFSPPQYDRFEAYRRHALPKQAVRKVIQQTTGHQVSQPVAQIIAGFGKVFVGEIIEKARQVQSRRGETGPLSPDHLREAYRLYQEETGRVGAARPVRSKRLFVR